MLSLVRKQELLLEFVMRFPAPARLPLMIAAVVAFTSGCDQHNSRRTAAPLSAPAAPAVDAASPPLPPLLPVPAAGGPVATLRSVIARAPGDPAAHAQLGRVLQGQRKFAEAEQAFRTAVRLDSQNPTTLASLGASILLQNDPTRFSQAAALLNKALMIEPSLPLARLALADLFQRTGRLNEALAQYRAVLAAAPDSYDAGRGMAGVLYVQNKKDAAYQAFEALARRFPGDTRPLKELASLQIADKQPEKARATYQKILAHDPSDADAHVGLGQQEAAHGRLEAAEKEFRTVLRSDAKHLAATVLLADLLTRQNRTDDVLSLWESLTRAAPDNWLARWQLAQEYKQRSRDPEALREMRAIRPSASDPARLAYLMGPANLLGERGRHAEAAHELQRLAQAAPDQPVLRYALADALERAGQADEAGPILKELAAASGPNDGRAYVALGGYHERAKRGAEAIVAYEMALRRTGGDGQGSVDRAAREGLRRVRGRGTQR